MGRDKGLLHLAGVPLVERVLLQVADLCDEVMLITNRPDEYQRFGMPMHTVVRPGTGALGGLYSALHYAIHDCILVLSSDMPFVNRPLLEHILGLAPGWDAVVPRMGDSDRIEPLRALYRKSCVQPIVDALDAGRRRVISFFGDVKVRYVEMEEIERFDPGGGTFFNINTPADLTDARELAASYPLSRSR